MHLTHRLRLPAVFCSFCLLFCALISRPFVSIGICDDWPYILSAQKLAATGHLVYNGGATAMLGWQLYLGGAFIKLFGFSFTAPRMSTLAIGMLIAFLLQRTLVRLDITERNATIGTLAFVLSPIFLLLSVTFMSDIQGLFALVLCLYACVRALQAASPRAAISWVFFAVISNTIGGSARQIAWLGVLVMVPSTLWLLRSLWPPKSQSRLLLAGSLGVAVGVLCILLSVRWFAHQPYNLPEHLFPERLHPTHALSELFLTFLDVPFLLLPVALFFLVKIHRIAPRVIALICALVGLYLLLGHMSNRLHLLLPLEPTLGDWITFQGGYNGLLQVQSPLFLPPAIQAILTIAALGGLLCFFAFRTQSQPPPLPAAPTPRITSAQLAMLLGPFSLAYILLLLPRATTLLFDRYLIAPLVVVLILALRLYQHRIESRLPPLAIVFVALTAVYAIAVTHNTFSLYRGRLAIANELHAAGIPDVSINNGWDYNFGVELQHADYINDARILIPANAYHPVPAPLDPRCRMFWYDKTPHIHPLYAVTFYRDVCAGPAPFAPMHYTRWFASPGTLYVVSMGSATNSNPVAPKP